MASCPDTSEVKAVARRQGEAVTVVGNRVYDASQLVPSVVHFTRRQYLFLQAYRLGVTVGEAAAKAEMTVEEAEQFLVRPKTVAWLEDRALKDHIRNEWAEGGKWWAMGDACLAGEKHLSKDQQVVFLAFGDRVCPKPRDQGGGGGSGGTTINFNFSREAVQEAFRRQESIEAKLVDGERG